MITLARAGRTSAISRKKSRNATAVHITARPATAASTFADGSEQHLRDRPASTPPALRPANSAKPGQQPGLPG